MNMKVNISEWLSISNGSIIDKTIDWSDVKIICGWSPNFYMIIILGMALAYIKLIYWLKKKDDDIRVVDSVIGSSLIIASILLYGWIKGLLLMGALIGLDIYLFLINKKICGLAKSKKELKTKKIVGS